MDPVPVLIPLLSGLLGALAKEIVPSIVESLFANQTEKQVTRVLTENTWEGKLWDVGRFDNEPLNRLENIVLKVDKSRVLGRLNGELRLRRHNGERWTVTLSHGVIKGHCILFRYQNKNPAMSQIGGMIFQLNGRGTELEGLHCGLSPAAECLVSAKMTLSKS